MDDLLIQGGRLVTPGGIFEQELLVRDGRIAEIGDHLAHDAAEVLNLAGEYVLPGGVDVHVHLPWPTGSFISSDDFEHGTRAAAFGGTTTVIDFVIPQGRESLSAAVTRKRAEAQGNAWVDYGLHLNLRGTVRDHLKQVPELVKAGYPSIKIFLAYEGFRVSDADLPAILEQVGAAGGMVDVHAEDGQLADRLIAELVAGGRKTLQYYPDSRPAMVEVDAVEKMLALQATIPTPLHFHHISSCRAAELIGAARRAGRAVSAETCPHYLLFDRESFQSDRHLAAQLVCAPAIKTTEDQMGLWEALNRDWLNVLATDHCPYTLAQKENDLEDFTRTPGGIGGVELRLPLIHSAGVASSRMDMERFVEIWATNPAKLFGLYPRKGILAVGSDADLVVLDPNRQVTIWARDLHSNTTCSPYNGRQVTGWPVATILRGRILTRDGRLVAAQPAGEFLPRALKQEG